MEQNYMISTTISRQRTFYVEFFFHAWVTCYDILNRAKPYICWGCARSRDWKRVCGTSLNARRFNGTKLHDIKNNLMSRHFSRRNIFHARDTHNDILEREKSCTCWGSSRSRHWKRDCGKSLNTRRCKETTLHDIDNNLTFTHFSRRDIIHRWHTFEDI